MGFDLRAFFSYGFRPFFLFAQIYAALAIVLWVGAFSSSIDLSASAWPAHVWHAHEMLFGYTMAAITGFFLTAVPGWTGTKPVRGGTLAILTLVWVAGRMAMYFSTALPGLVVAAVDLGFIPLLLALVLRSLLARRLPRDMIFVPILTALFIANLMTHLDSIGVLEDGVGIGHRFGLNTVIVLIAIIGGRVVPAFTTNALRRDNIEPLPASYKWLDIAAVLSVVAVAAGELAQSFGLLSGATAGGVAATAAVLNGGRLAGWRGNKTLGQPILWIGHLGYAWLVVGLALKSAAHFDLLSGTAALHALTVGAVGCMTLGVMTRASLGHTGRALVVPPPIVLAYVLVGLAALVRVGGPMVMAEYYVEVITASGVLWSAAFAVTAVVFWPILTRPRLGGDS